jgi:fibronectin-binding autotransporter adhesin
LVVADSGNWLPRSQYTILTAAGGVSGQFASASSNFVFLTPTLSYGSNDVSLTLQRNSIDFNAVAKTPNEFAVATSLNKLSYGNVIYDALLLSNADTARKAFDQMSGEIHASIRTAIMDDERNLRDAVTNHLLNWTQDSGSQTGLMDNGVSVWTTATARGGNHQGDGNASTLDANGSGTLLGMDAPIGDVAHIGGVFGTGNLSDSVGALASSAHVHTRHAGLYASLQTGSFRLMSGAFYGWQNVNTDRHISFPAAAGTANSQSHANTVQAYVDGSYVFTLSHGTLAPFVDLAAQRLHTDAFAETGTAAALTGHAQSNTQSYGTLGLRGALQLNPQDTVQAHASLGWQHAWGDTHSTVTMQLLSGSNAFTVQGVPVARNAMAITAGLRILATPKLSLDATYNGQFAQRVNDQAAHLSLTYSF